MSTVPLSVLVISVAEKKYMFVGDWPVPGPGTKCEPTCPESTSLAGMEVVEPMPDEVLRPVPDEEVGEHLQHAVDKSRLFLSLCSTRIIVLRDVVQELAHNCKFCLQASAGSSCCLPSYPSLAEAAVGLCRGHSPGQVLFACVLSAGLNYLR